MDDSQELRPARKTAREMLEEQREAWIPNEPSGWRDVFDVRQQQLIVNCCTYYDDNPAGLPGHALMVIIAEMAALLDGSG